MTHSMSSLNNLLPRVVRKLIQIRIKSTSMLWILVLIGGTEFTGCKADPRQHTHSVTIGEGGLIFVDVLIADSIDSRFILDTGAGIHVISNSLLSRVASIPQGRFAGFRHTGERVDFDMFEIKSINIGQFRQENPIVASWSVLDSFKIDGILSLKFFESLPFTLDLRDSILVFETSASLSTKMSNSRIVPILVHQDRGRTLDIFAHFRVSDSLRLECIIDSGSPTTVMDARYLIPLGIDTTSSLVQKRFRRSLFGSSTVEYKTTVSSISLWDVPNSAMSQVGTVFKHRLIYDGLVGTDFLLGKRVTFDIPNRRLSIDVQ